MENFELLLAYYFKLYTQRYPVLKTGRMPNQSILGRFAYPGHNPYRMLPYGEFPPERIVEIAKLNDYYERGTDRLIKRVVWRVYDTQTGRIKERSDYLQTVKP